MIEKAIPYAPDLASNYFKLGSLLARRGQLEEGIAELRKALELNPNSPETHRNLGLALEQKGEWDEAFAQFELALQEEPDYTKVANDRENARRTHELTHGAPPVILAPAEDPLASTPNAEGIRLAEEKNYAESVFAFRRAIRARPDYPEAFFNLGVTSDRLAQAADAERSYRSAILRRPNYPEARFNLGMSLARRSDYKGAAEQWQEALKERPDWDLPKRALETIGAGSVGNTP